MARSAPDAALVLAAGLGTRLRPLTSSRAKPSLPVAGVSLIERVAGWLADAGIRDLLVNLHYRPETITALLGDGTRHGYAWSAVLGFVIAVGGTLALARFGEPASETDESVATPIADRKA